MHKFVFPEWIQKIAAAVLETLVPPQPFPPTEEHEFRTAHAKRFLPHRRATLLIALFTWSIFGYWDWLNYQSQLWPYTTEMFVINTAIRLSGAMVIGVCLMLFWAREIHNEKTASGLLLGTATFCSFGVIAMLFVVPTPINYLYYFFGLILIVIFTFNLLYVFSRPLIIQAATTAFFLLASDQIYPIFESNLTAAAFFYYFGFCFFGVSHTVRFEVSERERFIREHMLEEQRQIADKERFLANKASTRAEQEAKNAQFERKRSVEAMAAAARQREMLINLLKLKNKEREQFIRAAYHDTMQPLAAISAQAMMMKRDPSLTSNNKAIEALSEIERSGRDIGEGMRGIYDLFQWGVHEPKLEVIYVKKLLEEIERRFAESIKFANLQFRIRQSAANDLCGKSDSAMLKRVIENLVSNAIKYTKKGGILLGAVGFRSTLRIDIWDTGIGLTPEQLSKIFEEFYQVDEQSPGIGLGLSIVRLLVERLPEHELGYNSRTSHGSKFSITLPRLDASSRCDEQSLSVKPSTVSLMGVYVILVEDDQNVLNGLRVLFESFGCLVRAATNLKDIEQLIEDAPDRAPDVVISDYRLRNNETGLDVSTLIEVRFNWTTVPIVFYSADFDIPKELLAKPFRYTERKGIELDSLIIKVQEAVLAARTRKDEEILTISGKSVYRPYQSINLK